MSIIKGKLSISADDSEFALDGRTDFTEEEIKEFDKHSVACWNGCEGINPAAVPMMVEALEKADSVLTRWRIILEENMYQVEPDEWDTIRVVFAALAKAKEGE